MESYEKLVLLIEGMKDDVDKFSQKGNKSAGTRIRVQCQEIKKLAQELRVAIKELKNTEIE